MPKCVCCKRTIKRKEARAYFILPAKDGSTSFDKRPIRRYACDKCNKAGKFSEWIDAHYPIPF